MAQLRQVAHKIRIGDLLNGNIVFDGDKFSSLEVKDKKVSRVNAICNIVEKYENPEKNFNSITLDDGTGQIRVKAFSDSAILLKGLEIGDTVRIVGWLRYYNDEIYILPEIAVRMDPKWGYVRRLELIKEYGEFKEPEQPAPEPVKETVEQQTEVEEIEREKVLDLEDSSKMTILKKIKESAEGIDIEKLIMELKFSVDEINNVIKALIAEGEIYESRPGFLRSLD